MKKILVVVLVVAIALIGATAVLAADHTSMTCRTCHTPHHGDGTTTPAPLWDVTAALNRDTASAAAGSAGSMLCLVCHDGTVAMATSAKIWASGATGNHPVGVTGTTGVKGITANTVADTSANVKYIAGKVECQSCHYVHLDATKVSTQYVRKFAGATSLCQSCHTAW